MAAHLTLLAFISTTTTTTIPTVPTETTATTTTMIVPTETTTATATTRAVPTETTTTTKPACDPNESNLLDFKVWEREAGYWVGEYTLLGADGDFKLGDSPTKPWPYPYDNYTGFIHIDIQKNVLTQKNVFLYPPQKAAECNTAVKPKEGKKKKREKKDKKGRGRKINIPVEQVQCSNDRQCHGRCWNERTGRCRQWSASALECKKGEVYCLPRVDVIGDGTCGANGNEKIFSAQQQAVDCDGNLAGPYPYGNFVVPTTTTRIGDDTVLYQVRFPPQFGGGLVQNQLTSVPGNGLRVRTAQLFGVDSFKTLNPISTGASYYRERRVDKQEWLRLLQEKRKEYNIRPEDHCSVSGSAQSLEQYPSQTTCTEHFGFDLE